MADADTIRAPEPGEGTNIGEAQAARETIGQAVEARAAKRKPPEQPAPEPTEEDLLKQRYLTGPQDNGVELLERARLNAQNSRYRGTAFGAMRLAALANIYTTDDPEGASPEEKKARAEARDEYLGVLGDLAAHDEMPTFSGLKEGSVALAGSLAGAMTSPESFVGVAAKGATWASRTLRSAVQQMFITGATDPVVQALDIKAGIQGEYDPNRTLAAAGTGFVLGAALHSTGEAFGHLLGQRALRKELYDLGQMDPSFNAAQHAAWALDPANGIQSEASPRIVPRETPEVPTPEAPQPQRFEHLTTEQLENVIARSEHAAASMETTISEGRLPEETHAHYQEQIDGTRENLAPYKEELERRLAVEETSGTEPAAAAEMPREERVTAREPEDTLALKAPQDQAMADRGQFQGETQRPAEGVSHLDENGVPYSPEQTAALQSLQQQSVALADAIGFNLRQGRVTMKDALGIYKGASDTVRVKQVPDFAVVSHEAGHAMEAKAGPELTALTERFENELAPLDYDPEKARVNEGFAEWVRMRIGNPAYARNVAPAFSNAFESYMLRSHPEMLKAINDAAGAYRAWREASSVDSIGSVVQHKSRDPRGVAKVVAEIKEEGLPATISTYMEKGYDGLIDKFAPVTRAAREMTRMAAEREGGPILFKRTTDPDFWVRSARYAANAARVQLQHGVVPYGRLDPVGASMTEALTMALGKPSRLGKWDQVAADHFDTYLISRMGEYLWRRYDAGQMPREPVPFSKGDAVQAMTDFEKMYPQFRAASDKVFEYTRNLLQKAYEAGEITADAYKGASEYEFYVPLLRDRTDKPGAGRGAGKDRTQPQELVKRRTGSMRDILSPVESIKMMTMWAERQIRQGEALRTLAALSDRAGPNAGKYVERIPAHEARVMTADLTRLIEERAKDLGLGDDVVRSLTSILGQDGEEPIIQRYFTMERAAARGEPILFFREGGELQAVRVSNAKEGLPLYEALTLAPEPIKDVWVNVMAAAGSALRTGIVSAPTFLFSNFFKDQLQVAMMHPGYVPLLSGLPGIRDELMQTRTALRRAYLGGPAGGSATGVIHHGFDQGVNDLAKKGYAVQHFTSIKGALDVMNLTETATRNSLFQRVYKAGMEKGLTEFEAGVEAAHQAKDIMDFDRSGSHTAMIRNFLPFFNANIQGEEKVLWRTMVVPLLRKMRDGQFTDRDHAEFRQALNTWMMAAGGGIALGAGWAALNWEKEQYRDASAEVKGTHIVVPMGYDVATIPKPYELGMGFTLGEFMYGLWVQQDPRMAAQFGRAAKAALLPPNPLTELPLVAPTIALTTGTNLYTGRPIVPDRLQKLVPEEQYTDATSPMAKSIGKIMGWSPMKVEYAMGAYFGTWGRDVFAASNGLSENTPAKELDNTLFLRRFFKDPYRISETTKQFWELASTQTGKFNQDVATYNKFVDTAARSRQPITQATEFLSKLPDAEKAFVTLKSGAKPDGKPAFTPEQKRLHPLQHAYDAVTLLNEFSRELSTNTQTTWAKRGQLPLSQEARRDLLRDVRTLTALEMRNSFAVMKVPGYEDRQVFNPNDIMAHIRSISPEVAAELSTRYATAKIYSTETIQRAWPTLQRETVQHGTGANLGRITSNAMADGYQFGAQRVKKPGPIRAPIVPAVAPQPQP